MLFKHHLFRRALAIIIVGTSLVVAGNSVTSLAAEIVTIDNQVVNCDSITVTYTVIVGVPEDYGLIYAHRADGTQLGLETGPGSSGQHTVTVTFPAEPAGTSLYARVSVGAGAEGRVEAQGVPTACGGSSGGESESSAAPEPSWGGLSDGRLNPDQAESYSIWCNFDRIDVWRSVPQSQMLHSFWLTEVLVMPDGNTLNGPDGMMLTRVGDLITIAGTNGNYAPEWRSKSFSLAQCIERNGNAPVLPGETIEDDSPPVVASPCSSTSPRVTLRLDESMSPRASGSASNLILLTNGSAEIEYQVEDDGDTVTVELDSDRPERAAGALSTHGVNAECILKFGPGDCRAANVAADGTTWYRLYVGSGEIARPENEPRTLLTLRFTDSDGCVNVHGTQVTVIDSALPQDLLEMLLEIWFAYLCQGPIVIAAVLPAGVLAQRIRRRNRE